jgi:hypothetical protein
MSLRQKFSPTAGVLGTCIATRIGTSPIIDAALLTGHGYTAAEANNINGPTLWKIPGWIDVGDRADPTAVWYLYFAHHSGHFIRMAWAADSILDDETVWTLYDVSGDPAASPKGVFDLGPNNKHWMHFSTTEILGHVASPEILDDGDRVLILPHGGAGGSLMEEITQITFLLQSPYGLNFNGSAGYDDEGGIPGYGGINCQPCTEYGRIFTVGGRKFAYTGFGELWRAPTSDIWAEGIYTWEKLTGNSNPLARFYSRAGDDLTAVRHPFPFVRSGDPNVYLFWSCKYDAPESIFCTTIDTNSGSIDPSTWRAVGKRLILTSELAWEGVGYEIRNSSPSDATEVHQLRDPHVVEDTSNNKIYLTYCGAGEEAIGLAELTFFDAPNWRHDQVATPYDLT